MKKYFMMLAISGLTFSACNGSSKNNHEVHDKMNTNGDSTTHATATDTIIRPVQVVFTNINTSAGSAIREIVNQYLAIKNALTSDNGTEAAKSANALIDAMKKLDKSLLTAEQKKAYDNTEEELKEHARHIAANSGKIDHQRSHFSMMSEEAYELIKNFGAGRTVYHDHCPMAMDNKGAMWISEVKDIKNPYFGAKMPTCGKVEEVLQ